MINCPFKEYKKTTYVASALAAVTAGYFAFKYYRASKKVDSKKIDEVKATQDNEVKQQEDEVKPASQ